MRFAFAILIGLAGLLRPLPAVGALNLLTNEWKFDSRSSSDSPPAIGADGAIYFGTWAGNLWALNPNGTPKWAFAAQDEIRSAPAVGSDGTIYFGSRDRNCYAVSPKYLVP
jgi:outer membrane protein assembly factor BamB